MLLYCQEWARFMNWLSHSLFIPSSENGLLARYSHLNYGMNYEAYKGTSSSQAITKFFALPIYIQADCKFLIFAHHQPLIDAFEQYLVVRI